MECICLSPGFAADRFTPPVYAESSSTGGTSMFANAVDIEPFFSAATAEDKQKLNKLSTVA